MRKEQKHFFFENKKTVLQMQYSKGWISCCLKYLFSYYFLEKSFFLNKDLRSTIHPHEMVNAGKAAVNTASRGDVCENINGLKNNMKVIAITRNNIIRSIIVDGGVRKIFLISISTFTFIPTFQSFLLLKLLSFRSVINLSKYLYKGKDMHPLP